MDASSGEENKHNHYKPYQTPTYRGGNGNTSNLPSTIPYDPTLDVIDDEIDLEDIPDLVLRAQVEDYREQGYSDPEIISLLDPFGVIDGVGSGVYCGH